MSLGVTVGAGWDLQRADINRYICSPDLWPCCAYILFVRIPTNAQANSNKILRTMMILPFLGDTKSACCLWNATNFTNYLQYKFLYSTPKSSKQLTVGRYATLLLCLLSCRVAMAAKSVAKSCSCTPQPFVSVVGVVVLGERGVSAPCDRRSSGVRVSRVGPSTPIGALMREKIMFMVAVESRGSPRLASHTETSLGVHDVTPFARTFDWNCPKSDPSKLARRRFRCVTPRLRGLLELGDTFSGTPTRGEVCCVCCVRL